MSGYEVATRPAAHRTASPGGSAHSSRQAIAARGHRKFCGGLAEAGNQFTAAERAFYTNTAKQNQLAVQAIARELQSVEPVAPGRLKSPMRDMIAAFHTFAAALAHPTARSRTQLAALAQRLVADGKQITGYLAAHCTAD